MIVAIVGDVHTNCQAWQTVLDDMRRWRVEAIWGLGDWLGYGTDDPTRLWDLLGPPNPPRILSVVGNHDLAVLEPPELHLPPMNEQALQVIGRQRKAVRFSTVWRDGFRPWLSSLPYLLSPIRGVYLAHGAYAVRDELQHIPFWYTPSDQRHEQGFRDLCRWVEQPPPANGDRFRCMASWDKPLLLITGHTHLQAVWQRDPVAQRDEWPKHERSCISPEYIQECVREQRAVEWKVVLEPTPEAPVWLNPGSVGQPRDDGAWRAGLDWRWAKYAILEWENDRGILWLRWVPYQQAGNS